MKKIRGRIFNVVYDDKLNSIIERVNSLNYIELETDTDVIKYSFNADVKWNEVVDDFHKLGYKFTNNKFISQIVNDMLVYISTKDSVEERANREALDKINEKRKSIRYSNRYNNWNKF